MLCFTSIITTSSLYLAFRFFTGKVSRLPRILFDLIFTGVFSRGVDFYLGLAVLLTRMTDESGITRLIVRCSLGRLFTPFICILTDIKMAFSI
jgi:hypothetical protein